MSSVLLGERLTLLRTTQAKESVIPAFYTRASVAHVAGVSADALARLEKTGGGTTATLAAVLRHYQNEGINLAWVLEPDNTDIPLYGFRDILQYEKLPQAREPIADLHRLLQPVMVGLGAGQELTPHDVHTLLTQVQREVLHALKHLLPPRRLVQGEADLRAFQRVLPPVPASSSGWRPASLYTVPYHYYEAGESLPQCGEEVSYLAYDPGAMDCSDSLKCGKCRHQVGITAASRNALAETLP